MKNRSVRLVLVSVVGAASLGFAAPAFAEDVSPQPGATPLPVAEPVVFSQKGPEAAAEAVVGKSTVNPATQLSSVKARGAAAIAARQRTLSDLVGKLGSQAKDCGSDAAMLAKVSATSTGLNGVGASLAASVDLAAAKVLYQSIFTSFRVYLLVAPQAGKVIRCDVILARNEALTAEGAKVQASIDAAKARGANTAVAQAAKDAAMVQLLAITPSASIAGVIGLVPDMGDKALQAANTAALNVADAALDANYAAQRAVNIQFDAVRKLLSAANKVDKTNDKEVKKAEEEAKRTLKKAVEAAERAAKKAEHDAKKAAKQAAKKTK